MSKFYVRADDESFCAITIAVEPTIPKVIGIEPWLHVSWDGGLATEQAFWLRPRQARDLIDALCKALHHEEVS